MMKADQGGGQGKGSCFPTQCIERCMELKDERLLMNDDKLASLFSRTHQRHLWNDASLQASDC